MENLVYFLLGVISSIIIWWIFNHFLIADLRFADHISRIRTDDSESMFRYRIKIKNTGPRRAIDLEFDARFRVRGLVRPTIWEVVKLNIKENDRIPFIDPQKNVVIRVYPEETEEFLRPRYGAAVVRLAQERRLSLDDLLSMEGGPHLRVTIFCYDGFSGARKLYVSKNYTMNDIKEGNYDGLAVRD